MARTSIIDFHTRQRERLANLAAETSRHARTNTEAAHIAQLVEAVRQGHIAVRDAHQALAGLRRQQLNDRQKAA